MIEKLLSGSRKECGDIELPANLGPGPQTLLADNGYNGFFGETTSEELINGQSLASLVDLTAGTLQNSTIPWLKFFYNGEIVFIPRKTIRHSLSWNHIQAVNAVYGDRIVEIQGYQFRIELIEGLTHTPPAVPIAGGRDGPWTHGSMWNELLYYVAKEHTSSTYHKRSQVGDNWADYPQDDSTNGLNFPAVGNGLYNWCKETHPTSSNERVYRGGNAVTGLNWSWAWSTTYLYGWRPALFLLQ